MRVEKENKYIPAPRGPRKKRTIENVTGMFENEHGKIEAERSTTHHYHKSNFEAFQRTPHKGYLKLHW